MKRFSLAALLIPATSLYGLGLQVNTVPADYTVAQRSAHENVCIRVVSVTNKAGVVTSVTNSYRQIATGLNYWDPSSKQWKESKEEIVAYPGGAAATNGQHQIIFAGDLATAGAIDMQMAGKRFQSRILGLSYQDLITGSNVLIAELKGSVPGVIVPPNQVLYANAFDSVNADVLYTYTKSGFEQDIILRQRPPLPEVFGLNSVSAVLQVLTEFESAPTPVVNSTMASTGTDFALPDQRLDFGSLAIGAGRAFAIGQDPLSGISVSKEWATLEGRTFLVEQIPVAAIAEQLDKLPSPKQASLKPAKGSVKYVVSVKRLLPARKLAQAGKREMKTASLSWHSPGFVLDYTALNTSQNNYRFQGDTTYYLSGNVSLGGTNNTFEAGTVLKYATNITLTVNTPVTWLGTAYRPVVMVSQNDDSVGETISGSTGNPVNRLAARALYFDATTANTNLIIQHLRVGQAQTAIAIKGKSNHVVSHVQLVNCGNGLALTNTDVALRNALFDHVLTNFTGSSSTGRIEHLTTDVASWFNNNIGTNLFVTNSLLVGITNFGTFTTVNNATNSSGSGVFQSVGAGYHYLAANSTNRNAGTTAINSSLAADLKKMTTYPPTPLSNQTYLANATLNLQVQRNADTPDIGYHYCTLDYLINEITVSGATLTLSKGLAVAVYGDYGFILSDSSPSIIGQGTAETPNELGRYQTVQEQPVILSSATNASPISIFTFNNYTDVPTISLRFTDIPAMAGTLLGGSSDGSHVFLDNMDVNGYYHSSRLNLQDCQLRGGTIYFGGSGSHSASGIYIGLTNNLIERGLLYFYRGDTVPMTVNLWNNLFWQINGYWWYSYFAPETPPIWQIYDNMFDHCNIYEGGTDNYNVMNSNNGYTGTTVSLWWGTSDRLDYSDYYGGLSQFPASFNYATGPLGRWYQSSTSLINAGSRYATAAGLYHYTTQTSQTKEANSVVDIGFHYVAVDGNGNPDDYDQDGVPDYLEDANGNGVVDSGETDPSSSSDPGLKVWISRPDQGGLVP